MSNTPPGAHARTTLAFTAPTRHEVDPGPEPVALAVDVLARVVDGELLTRVAGPAVARQMRRAAVDLMLEFDFLLGFRVGLDGAVHPPSALPGGEHVVRGIGRWLASIIDRVAALAPNLDDACVDRLAGDDADTLRAFGFFEAFDARRGFHG